MSQFLCNPDEATLKALCNLQNNSDFEKIVAYMQKAVKELALDSFRSVDDRVTHKIQGAGLALLDLIEMAGGSTELLTNMRRLRKTT